MMTRRTPAFWEMTVNIDVAAEYIRQHVSQYGGHMGQIIAEHTDFSKGQVRTWAPADVSQPTAATLEGGDFMGNRP